MQNSLIKIIKFILNKKNVEKLYKKLSKQTVIPLILLSFLFIFSFFFFKPYFYDYNSNKKVIEKKIKDEFKLDITIIGKISYKFLPSPRIQIKKTNLNFTKKKPVFIEEINIPISVLNNEDLKNINFKKFYVKNNSIEIYPSDFEDYFKYLTVLKNKDIIFKNCTLFFFDDQKNKVSFNDFYIKDQFKKNNHNIYIESFFSENKIKIKFKNNINGKKSLDIKFPKIGSNIKVAFDSSSSLKNMRGKSKIKLFDNILVINFEGKDKFKISKSFLRSKFLNSKIYGDISFFENLIFNLNLQINQVSFRKLIFHYFPTGKQNNIFNSGLIKKINGRFNISMKSTDSFIGRLNDVNMRLIFENGDIRVQNGSAKLPHNSKINFSFLFTENLTKPFIDFNVKFNSLNTKKILRKLNIYDKFNKETSVSLQGNIDIQKNKIRFKNIILNNRQKLDRKDVSNIEKKFDKFVLDEGVIGVIDFFRLKKFTKEILN